MRKVKNNLLSAIFLFLTINAASVSADDFATVSPSMLDLTLSQDEVVIEQVSLTIHSLCVRPFDVDVVASNPDVLVTNLTGELVNGCGGDKAEFKIEITGTGAPQRFELQFVDTKFGGELGLIPVTINKHAPNVEPLMGLLIRRNAIMFQVSSNGCTTKDDFQVEVLESYPLQLRLIRLQEDPCDAYLPLGTHIGFSYRELGIQRGDQLQVVNPLATVEVPPRRTRRTQ